MTTLTHRPVAGGAQPPGRQGRAGPVGRERQRGGQGRPARRRHLGADRRPASSSSAATSSPRSTARRSPRPTTSRAPSRTASPATRSRSPTCATASSRPRPPARQAAVANRPAGESPPGARWFGAGRVRGSASTPAALRAPARSVGRTPSRPAERRASAMRRRPGARGHGSARAAHRAREDVGLLRTVVASAGVDCTAREEPSYALGVLGALAVVLLLLAAGAFILAGSAAHQDYGVLMV